MDEPQSFSDQSNDVSVSSNLQNFLIRNKVPVALFLAGLIVLGFGLFLYKDDTLHGNSSVEILEDATDVQKTKENITVEIAGAVVKPGVYELSRGDRVEDLLQKSGGFSDDVDKLWVDKYVNRASILSDGQKIYVPTVNQHLDTSSATEINDNQGTSSVRGVQIGGLVSINTATFNELDSLPGIGQVYATNIIEHRPYSSIEELLSKGVLKKNVYEKIKDKISAY